MGLGRHAAAFALFAFLLTGPVAVPAQSPSPTNVASKSTLVFRFADADLLPEDVVYDEETKRYYVSSIRRRTVMSCTTEGHCEPLLKAKGNALYSMLAMSLVETNDRLADRRLWVLTSSTGAEEHFRKQDKGQSALLSIELYNGMIFDRLDAPDDGDHAMGDMTTARDGTLYISDGKSGDLFLVRPGSDQIERLVPKRTFRSPQTPALNEDQSLLFVPDYSKGIAIVTLKDRSVRWMESTEDLRGIDGMYFYKNSLIAIQNGTNPKQIVKLHLDKQMKIKKYEVLDAGTARLGEPTHGVIRGDWLYFLAHTGWDRVIEKGDMQPGQPAELRRLKVD